MTYEFGADRILERNRLYRKHYKTLIATSADRGTMYIDALQGLLAVLKQDFNLSDYERPEQRSDFLRSLGREMEIEAEDASPAQVGG
ncbi:MAG: hypothetical protein JRE73_14720 [Deltaproteobacteria bacterium]|nr:hypothetical protein [Deltaproteobacteria bacterium]